MTSPIEHDSGHFTNVRKLMMTTDSLNFSSHEQIERLFRLKLTDNPFSPRARNRLNQVVEAKGLKVCSYAEKCAKFKN